MFHSTGRFPWSQLNSMLRNTNVRRNYANIKPGGLQIISNMAQYMQLQSSRLWLSYQNRSNKFSERMRSLASKDNMLAPSASNEGSRRSTITEKARTRTFSLLKTPTALSHSHIRHYSDVKLGHWHKHHNQRAALRVSLCQSLMTFVSASQFYVYCGTTLV